MRSLITCCILLSLFLPACKKDPDRAAPVITSFTPQKGAYNFVVTIRGYNFDSLINSTSVTFNGAAAQVIFVSDTMITARVPQNATTGKIAVTVEGRTGTSADDFIILTGKWVLKQEVAAPGFERRHELISFVIGNKVYAGLGHNGGSSLKDLWEYDPSANTWHRKADCGIDVTGPAVMILNGKAYVVGGFSVNDPCCNTEYSKQVWEYDPVTNVWTRKGDVPFVGRWGSFGIAVNNKGYVGMGSRMNSGTINDWWEYNATTDTWAQKANVPLPPIAYAFFPTGFVMNNKIYAGIMAYGSGRHWLEYDPLTDTWVRKTDYPGDAFFAPCSFVLGNKGYVVGGGSECWEYDPAFDSWRQLAFFANPRIAGTTFTLNNKGYYFMGGYVHDDLWEFTP